MLVKPSPVAMIANLLKVILMLANLGEKLTEKCTEKINITIEKLLLATKILSKVYKPLLYKKAILDLIHSKK